MLHQCHDTSSLPCTSMLLCHGMILPSWLQTDAECNDRTAFVKFSNHAITACVVACLGPIGRTHGVAFLFPKTKKRPPSTRNLIGSHHVSLQSSSDQNTDSSNLQPFSCIHHTVKINLSYSTNSFPPMASMSITHTTTGFKVESTQLSVGILLCEENLLGKYYFFENRSLFGKYLHSKKLLVDKC